MSNRSRQYMRPILMRAYVAFLLLLVTFPRPTVHSHTTLTCAGVDAATLAQHIQLFHSKPGSEVPTDAPHVHWQLGTNVSVLPSTAPQALVSASVDQSLTTLDFDCLQVSLPLGSPSVNVTVSLASELSPVHDQAGPCQRIRFCVWTC